MAQEYFLKLGEVKRVIILLTAFVLVFVISYLSIWSINITLHYCVTCSVIISIEVRGKSYVKAFMESCTITGNVHIAYSSGNPTSGVHATVIGCASCHTLSPENAIHLAATGVQVLIYMGQIQSAVGGVNTRGDSLTDFHLQREIEYISGFIGNDYKKVAYLDGEVYDTPACSLI